LSILSPKPDWPFILRLAPNNKGEPVTGILKIAAAHVAPVFLDPMASAEKAARWIAEAAAQDIKLLVFPEVFLPGFPYWINCYPPLIQAGLNRHYQDVSIEADGPEIALVHAAAREHGVTVVMGASERRKGARTCHNSCITLTPDDRPPTVHRKLQPTYAERYIWGQGDGSTLTVIDTPVGRVGALACWEHMMNLARQALIEQQMQIHAGLWPALSTLAGFDQVANIQIEAVMRAHAITGQCFVACASSPVSQEMLDVMDAKLGPQALMTAGGGWTAIIHPFGGILAGPVTGADEMLVTAQINLDDIKDVKLWVDTTGHYARPEVLSLNHNRAAFHTVNPEG
jgi:nitrilase